MRRRDTHDKAIRAARDKLGEGDSSKFPDWESRVNAQGLSIQDCVVQELRRLAPLGGKKIGKTWWAQTLPEFGISEHPTPVQVAEPVAKDCIDTRLDKAFALANHLNQIQCTSLGVEKFLESCGKLGLNNLYNLIMQTQVSATCHQKVAMRCHVAILKYFERTSSSSGSRSKGHK